MIAFDTEDDGKGEMFLCCFFDGKNYTDFLRSAYKTRDDFISSIIKFFYDAKESMFIAHNLEYDLSNIFNGNYITLLEWFFSERLLYANLVHTRKKFIDSFNFSFSSLKEIGQNIGIEKIDIDVSNFKNISEQTIIKYCRNDCRVVYEYMTRIIETIERDFEIPIKNTLAGTAQRIFLEKFSEIKLDNMNVENDLLNSYYGGRVECFYTGHFKYHIFEIDVNSMYPYVMQKNLFPVDEYFKSDKPLSDFYIALVNVTIKKCHLPVLPYKQNGLLIFPCGTFQTWATSIEINKAKELNQIVKINYIVVYNFFELEYIFQDIINYYYTERKKAKKLKNEFLSGYYKRLMNSIYGRFCMNKPLKILCEITDKNKCKIKPINNLVGYIEKQSSSGKGKNFALGIFVTSYARIELFNLLLKVNKYYSPIYCDTDSVYFTDFNKDSLQGCMEKIYKIFPVNNELGGVSFKAYKEGYFFNAKSYHVISYNDAGKMVQKGVQSGHREEFFKTGKTKQKKPVRLRSSLHGIQGLKVNEWIEQEYHLKTAYRKRKVIKSEKEYNQTIPLFL